MVTSATQPSVTMLVTWDNRLRWKHPRKRNPDKREGMKRGVSQTLPVKKPSTNIIRKKEKKRYMSKCINSSYQCRKVARYTYHRPTYHLTAAKTKKKKKRKTIQKSLSLEGKQSWMKFLDSRQETGPKAETRRKDRMSNRTRQNNKGADRKKESNDSPELPDRGERHRKSPASVRATDWLQNGLGAESSLSTQRLVGESETGFHSKGNCTKPERRKVLNTRGFQRILPV